MLTEKQYNLLMYISKVTKETGRCPSFDEMKDAIGLKSKSGIYSLITSLTERNFIRKLPHKARALEVVRLPRFKPQSVIDEEAKREEAIRCGSAKIPLYGKIGGCISDGSIKDEKVVCVPFSMVNNGNYYALTVAEDSMAEAGIIEGDTAIIKAQKKAANGDIVVAVIDDNEATLKKIQRDGNIVQLIPCNKNYQTVSLEVGRVKIQGILSGIIRKY
jgi:repressor LexA